MSWDNHTDYIYNSENRFVSFLQKDYFQYHEKLKNWNKLKIILK